MADGTLNKKAIFSDGTFWGRSSCIRNIGSTCHKACIRPDCAQGDPSRSF